MLREMTSEPRPIAMVPRGSGPDHAPQTTLLDVKAPLMRPQRSRTADEGLFTGGSLLSRAEMGAAAGSLCKGRPSPSGYPLKT